MQSEVIQPGKLTESQTMILKKVAVLGMMAVLMSQPAYAQTLKQTGVSIFNAIYEVIGVFGAIGLLLTAINWALGNPVGVHDPKKLFFQVLGGVAIAFGTVAIIQFIKTSVGGDSSGIGNL